MLLTKSELPSLIHYGAQTTPAEFSVYYCWYVQRFLNLHNRRFESTTRVQESL